MFPDISRYCFPTLLCDADGIPTGQTPRFAKFDCLRLSIAGSAEDSAVEYEWLMPDVAEGTRDVELERAMAETKISSFKLDLCPFKIGCFTNQQCAVFPELVKEYPVLFDTLYWTDHVLKFVYRIYLQVMILARPLDQINIDNYLLSVRRGDRSDRFRIANLSDRSAFAALTNAVQEFARKVDRNSRASDLRASFDDFKKCCLEAGVSASDIRVNLHFSRVPFEVSSTDGAALVRIHRVVPEAIVTCLHRPELPLHISLFKRFLDEHYDDLRQAFPIYGRLENMFRLCSLPSFVQQYRRDPTLLSFEASIHCVNDDCAVVGVFPDSVLCRGRTSGKPETFQRVATPAHCRETFDNGGLLCAFAPKLKIRDCYETNLKTFHDCLAAEEQQQAQEKVD